MALRLIAGFWLVCCLVAWFPATRRILSSPSIAAAWVELLLGVAGGLLGLYLFWRGFRLLRRKQRIENTPVTRIAGAALGQVEVFGRVVGPYTLISPLAEMDCHYYRAEAHTVVDSDEGTRPHNASEILFTPFFVEDETGRVMIDPRGAQIDLPADFDDVGGDTANSSSLRFLARHGLLTHTVESLREYTIKPGDPLFVLGTLADNPGFGSMADARTPAFAHPGESYLSREAADLQRREALEAIGAPPPDPSAPAAATSDFDLHPRVLLCKGHGDAPFLLARHAPRLVVRDLQRESLLDLWGGPVLTVLSVGLVLRALSWW